MPWTTLIGEVHMREKARKRSPKLNPEPAAPVTKKRPTNPSADRLTVAQVADLYQTGREQVHRWIRSGDLTPVIRVGRLVRVTQKALDAFERRHTIGGDR